MDEVEAREQLRVLRELIAIYDEAHVFTATDVCKIHRTWLGPIYSWAGEYRQVNISKEDFPFAAARAGLGKDYEPMERIFSDVVRRTRRGALRAESGPDLP